MNYEFLIKTKIHFGQDIIEAIPEVAKQYGNKCFLVTTEDVAPLNTLYTRVKKILNNSGIAVEHFDGVMPNPTVEIVEEGLRKLQEFKPDFVLAVGGGSSIDTAKSIALLNDQDAIDWQNIFDTYAETHGDYDAISEKYMPLISIPTTAGTGSEVTQAAVLSYGEDKNTIFHPLNFSDHAFLDPKLLLTLPKKLTAATGFDSFSHAFESYINPKSTFFSRLNSLEAMKLVVKYLPIAVNDLKDIEAREQLMIAQTLAGVSLSNAGASAPHPLSEIIGGITHISHGESLALIFPEFIAANATDLQEDYVVINKLFDHPDCITDCSLSENIQAFLKTIDLYKSFDDYSVSGEAYEKIINSPILGFLPFGSKAFLQGIIQDSKQNR